MFDHGKVSSSTATLWLWIMRLPTMTSCAFLEVRERPR